MGLDQDTALRLLLDHRGMLLGYVNSIVRDQHLAEDVFQEVSLLVVRKHRGIPARESFPGWVRRAARLEALSALRRKRRARQVMR